jgi:type VI protein secretion system component VasA
VISIILASFSLPYLNSIVIYRTDAPKTDERTFHNKKKLVPKRTPLLNIFEKELPELIWDQDKMEELTIDIVRDAMPLVIKKIPRDQFEIFKVDLMNLAESGFYLNVSRWQNQPLFFTSHERERGGMIGVKNDKHTLYSNVTMVDFLRSVMNPDSYFSW